MNEPSLSFNRNFQFLMKLGNWGGYWYFLSDITTSRFALLETYGICLSGFFVVAYLEPLIVIKLGECHHRVSCSNAFGQLVFHGKFESCHPQNFVTMRCPVQSFWGLAIDSITFTNIFAKPMRFFWIDLPFGSLPPNKIVVFSLLFIVGILR